MNDRPWLRFYPENVPETVDIPVMPLYKLLEDSATHYPEQVAVIDGGRTLTYRELKGKSDRLASALSKKGFQCKDRLAIMLPNSIEYIITYYATLRLGGILVQVNPLYQSHELEHLFTDSRPKWFVGNNIQREKVRNLPLLDALTIIYVESKEFNVTTNEIGFYSLLSKSPDMKVPEVEILPREDVAVIQYTGGTTGKSKGVMLTHYNLIANIHQSFAFSDGFFEKPGERILSITPFFHVYGMTGALNLTIYAGGTVICMKRFQVEDVLNTIKTYKPTFFPGVPTMYIALLTHPDSSPELLSSLKVCNSGSAPMPVGVMNEFEKRTESSIVEGYGLSEASPITHRNPVTGLKKPGSIGMPIPNTESKVVDKETGTKEMPYGEIGELIIKGPQVMKGYWNNEEETKQTLRDGWLYTGDLATMDEDGYFYIAGRKKDMIIASGYNIFPSEIEEVLYKHPEVEEACVFGVPDTYRGETVKAAVVRKEDSLVTSEELAEWCKSQLASFKVPKDITIRKSLPKTIVGKVLRYKLTEEEEEVKSRK